MPDVVSSTIHPRSVRNLSEMRTRVRRDNAYLGTSWLSDADINDWLNEAQRRIAERTKWYRLTTNMGTTSGTAEYAVPSGATGRAIQIRAIYHDTLPLTAYKESDAEAYNWRFREESGTPQAWIALGASGFRLMPTPSVTDSDILHIVYAATPPTISGDTEHFYIPHGLEYALIDFAGLMAARKDAHGEGARRLPDLERAWEKWLRDADRSVGEAAEDEIVLMGGDALRFRRGPWPYLPAYTNISGS